MAKLEKTSNSTFIHMQREREILNYFYFLGESLLLITAILEESKVD